uniref:Transmembrane protein n=1 Tax=Mycena chlorophos TaxID=658473 RepID=A0ABQ0M5M3_MYCCL|nr:predicted protein [Mycena chlorophos]
MAVVVQSSVNDTSPTIFYSPIGDPLGQPDLDGGWAPHWTVPGFSSASIGAVGSGLSSHLTSLDGASLSLSFSGTGIQLFGNVTAASYSIAIDGQTANISSSADLSKNILFDVQGIANSNHTLSFVAHIPNSQGSIVQFSSAIVSTPPSPNIPISDFFESVLPEDAWTYQGRWTFANGSEQSRTAGDKATLQFMGTAFQLRGTSSPNAGKYSVTLDNITSTYNAQSSFTESDTLLFYASGLDANRMHHVEINNTGGASLILPTQGAVVFALSPNTTSVTSAAGSGSTASTSQSGLPSGTIAALALAGVLIFLFAAGALIFLLIYRPYKRRQRLLHQTPKIDSLNEEAASVLVVDVAPDALEAKAVYDRVGDFGGPSRDRNSRRSGFARWKEEVEGGRLGSWGRGALGIAFRHSDSSGGRETSASSNDYDLGSPSDGYKSSSSSNARYSPRAKGKGRESGVRWPLRRDKSLSPRYTIDLPLDEPPPPSRAGPSNAAHRDEPSMISSLSYMSSPSISPGTIPSEAPSHPPVRPSPYPNTHSRANSNNALLSQTAPPEPRRPTPPSQMPIPPPADPPRQDDRGSVREYDVDDSQSIIGDGAARIALRSLSPRTSENEGASPPKQRRTRKRSKEKQRQKTPSPLGTQPVVPPEPEQSAGELFLRATSPFQVDFNGAEKRLSGQSRVHFESGSTKSKSESAPALPAQARHLQEISFLDFTSSSEGSMMTRERSQEFSVSSRSFGPKSHWSIGTSAPEVSQPRSRWSTTTAPSSEAHHQTETTNGSSSDSALFPFPVSLPASPHHPTGTFIPPLPMHVPGANRDSSAQSSVSLNAHPADLVSEGPTSPTDSYPMSVSDIHFRQSDSEEQHGSRQTSGSHPPLPAPLPGPSEQLQQQQSYIVTGSPETPTPSATLFTMTTGTPPRS